MCITYIIQPSGGDSDGAIAQWLSTLNGPRFNFDGESRRRISLI